MNDDLDQLAADLEAAGHTEFAARALEIATALDDQTLPQYAAITGTISPASAVSAFTLRDGSTPIGAQAADAVGLHDTLGDPEGAEAAVIAPRSDAAEAGR